MRYLAQLQVYDVAQNTEMPVCLHLICVMLVKVQNPTACNHSVKIWGLGFVFCGLVCPCP